MAVISLTDYSPRERYDGNAWTSVDIEGSADLSSWDPIETITFDDPDDVPAAPKTRSFTTVVDDPEVIYVRVVWIDDDDNSDVTDLVALIEPPQLATVQDVRTRLGRTLTDAQDGQVNLLISMATVNIFNAVDEDLFWEPPVEIQPVLTVLCVEIVCRAMSNPQSMGQISESLGAYSHTRTFPREIPGSGIMLTRAEELMLRRLVYGSNAAMGPSNDLSLNGDFGPITKWIG